MATVSVQSPKGKKRNYFGTQMFFLKIIGCSVSPNQSIFYQIYSLLLFFSAFLYVMLDIYELTKHDIEVIANIAIYTIAGLIALAKAFVSQRNRFKLGELLAKLQEEPFLPNPERGGDIEEKMIQECVWITNMQARVYYIVVIVTYSVTLLYIILRRITSSDYHNWQFSYGPFTVLNVTYSPNYEISLLYQNVSLVYCGFYFVTIDLLLGAILAHISYQFKILHNYMNLLVPISYCEMVKVKQGTSSITWPKPNATIDGSIVPWVFLKKILTNAVQYHLAIIGIVDDLEAVFSELLLFYFMGTLGLLCFTVYTYSTTTNSVRLIMHVGEAAVSCLQVLTVCYWGHQVLHESQQVGEAVYKSNFVGTDIRFQKSLALIIRRSQKPSVLTAGGFTVISLTTFLWILRSSYSAFMVLRGANANKI